MLEAQHLTFGYERNHLLLNDVSLQVYPRERLWLDAPSGRGKTTLCRLLAGYEQPQSGLIMVDGEPLPSRGICSVQLIGQHPEHALDPRMRMRASLHEAGHLDAELLDQLGIPPAWLTRYPHELSGGELQRFCIARALMVKPRYLIADEMSTMLDALTQARIWRVVLNECERRDIGLVFTTHSPSLAFQVATRTVHLDTLLSAEDKGRCAV